MKILPLVIVLVLLVHTSMASPLVFKVTKEVNTNESTEIAVFDTSKYKQIRIGLSVSNKEKTEGGNLISLYAVEDATSIFIQDFYIPEKYATVSVLLANPPTKLAINAKGKGVYSVFIWASQ